MQISNRSHYLVCALATGLFACGSGNNSGTTNDTTALADSTTTVESSSPTPGSLTPKGPKPAWAPDIQPGMQVVIEKLDSFKAAPLETLTPDKARQNPTPTDAVMALVKENNIPVPTPQVDTTGKEIPVSGGTIHARIYTPKNGNGPFPVVVYFHGGGWVIADINTYDASAQGIAEQAGAVVVSVEYRKGPEHKFPTAHNDAFAAYEWTLKNAADLKGDPKKIAVAGESAGGNLAANVSIMARDKKIQVPVHEVLVYPVANNDMNTDSYKKNENAKPLNKAMMSWFVKYYLPSPATAADPRISLVKANLKGLPSTTIITAELDPLHDDGKLLADKLKDAGVDVNYKNYDGVTHEFFGMALIVPEAKDAQGVAVSDLKKAFSK